MSRVRRLGGDLAATLLLAGLAWVPASLGAPGPRTVKVDLGPNDGDYIRGFAPLYEIEPGLAARWSSHDASLVVPLEISGGPAELSFRYSRVLPQTADVEVLLGGHTIDRFFCRGGGFSVRRVRLGALGPTPLTVAFRVDSHDRRNLGLRLDWMQVAVGKAGRIRPAAWERLRLALFGALAYGILRLAGFGVLASLLLTLPWIAAQGVWAFLDPFAAQHVARKLALPALVVAGAAALGLRRRPAGRWLTPVVLTSVLLRGAGVFHPAYFYPDVMNHRRYVFALSEAEGSLVARGVAAQKAVKTAYPRYVAGKAYAFPYSPLYFVPFTWLPRDAGLVEDALRQVSLAAAAAEPVVVYLIGVAALGPEVGVLAAVLAALLPGTSSRLLLAMWPTLAGHLLDLLVVAAALGLAARPDSRRRLGLLAAASLAALLTYISSLFNVGAFLLLLALLEPRLRGRVLAVLVLVSGLTVALLYAGFTRTFLFEILPALVRGGGSGGGAAAARVGPLAGLASAGLRIPLFYGYAFPLLAGAGLVVARRRAPPGSFRVLAAYALAVAALVTLRGASGGLFKDLKEIIFMGPLLALLAAQALAVLAAAAPRGRLAVGLATAGILALFLARFRAEWHADARMPGAPTVRGESATLAPDPPPWPRRTPSPSS